MPGITPALVSVEVQMEIAQDFLPLLSVGETTILGSRGGADPVGLSSSYCAKPTPAFWRDEPMWYQQCALLLWFRNDAPNLVLLPRLPKPHCCLLTPSPHFSMAGEEN